MPCDAAITIARAVVNTVLTAEERAVIARHLLMIEPTLLRGRVSVQGQRVIITAGEVVVTWDAQGVIVRGPTWLKAEELSAKVAQAAQLSAMGRDAERIATLLAAYGAVESCTVAAQTPSGASLVAQLVTARPTALPNGEIRVLVISDGTVEVAIDGSVTETDAAALTTAVFATLQHGGIAFARIGAVELHRTGAAHSHVRNEVRHG